MNNAKLNFLIVGAAKSGTTSIYKYLLQHPNIYMPKKIKETYFWIDNKDILGNGIGFLEKDVIYDSKKYFSLFNEVDNKKHQAIGEACNGYLYFYKNAIPNIKENLGDPKIIIILRNPVERAYSGYLHLMRDNVINETFEECIEREQERMRQNYWWAFNIIDIGFYYNSVKTYCESFSDVKIMLFDDFRMNPNNFIKRIYNFLNLDTQVNLKYPIIYNKTGIPKNRYLHNLLNNKNSGKNFVKSTVPKKLVQNVAYYLRNMNLDKPGMEFETMNKLKCIYEKDIKQLENYIKRGLSVWLD